MQHGFMLDPLNGNMLLLLFWRMHEKWDFKTPLVIGPHEAAELQG